MPLKSPSADLFVFQIPCEGACRHGINIVETSFDEERYRRWSFVRRHRAHHFPKITFQYAISLLDILQETDSPPIDFAESGYRIPTQCDITDADESYHLCGRQKKGHRY